jgi:energy-coupling factor transporter ATP-binding protein EcfA2
VKFVVLIGASGSGKTTIANAIEQRYGEEVRVFYFDRIGVPSSDRMIAEYGSGEAWQRAKTFEWMARLAPLCEVGQGVLLEGQTRLSFLAEAAIAAGIGGYSPILVDCDDDTRVNRLTVRQQPELANAEMMNWADYLRRSAKENHCEILDTSRMSLDQCVSKVIARLRCQNSHGGAAVELDKP